MDSNNPGQLANTMVGRVWDAKPYLFSGKFGQRPHKMSVAAVALSHSIDSLGFDHRSTPALAVALGKILSQVELNGTFFGFNSTDQALLSAAANVFH